MRIKIISEGSGLNTEVINVETGERIENVTEATWHCKSNDLATVELKLINIPVEMIGSLKGEVDSADLKNPWKSPLPDGEYSF